MVEKRKPQLGWRNVANRDKLLYEPLFKLAFHEKMHIIGHGEVTAKWVQFVKDLFDRTPGFYGKEMVSVKSIRQQFDARIEQFKIKFGWDNGRCKNLSGEEGDMQEPDKTIKLMLKEIDDEEEKRDLKIKDKEKIHETAFSVLVNVLGEKKKKRDFKEISSPVPNSSSSTTSATSTPLSSVSSPDTLTECIRLGISSFTKSLDGHDPTPKTLKIWHVQSTKSLDFKDFKDLGCAEIKIFRF